jgi:MarR family transcriptional regulator, organic hydroperoxide resistance regulator
VVGNGPLDADAGAQSLGDDGLAERRAEVVEQVRGVSRAVQAALVYSAARAGLNQGDFQVLVRVVVAGGLTGGEIRRILGVSASSVTELADRLEGAGMVARTRPRSDRRFVVLKPTARGRRAVDRALGPALAAITTLVDELGEQELAVVGRFLDELEDRLGAISRP